MTTSISKHDPGHTFAKGDRVTWYANRGLVDATGTLVSEVYTDGEGIKVALVDPDPNPFVVACTTEIDVVNLKPVGGAR